MSISILHLPNKYILGTIQLYQWYRGSLIRNLLFSIYFIYLHISIAYPYYFKEYFLFEYLKTVEQQPFSIMNYDKQTRNQRKKPIQQTRKLSICQVPNFLLYFRALKIHNEKRILLLLVFWGCRRWCQTWLAINDALYVNLH